MLRAKIIMSTMLAALALAAPASGQDGAAPSTTGAEASVESDRTALIAHGAAGEPPWLQHIAPATRDQIRMMLGVRNEVSSPNWSPAFTMEDVDHRPGRTPAGCRFQDPKEIEIRYRAQTNPENNGVIWTRYRGTGDGCFPIGGGVIDYYDGRVWAGEVDLLIAERYREGGLYYRAPLALGFGIMTYPDGRMQAVDMERQYRQVDQRYSGLISPRSFYSTISRVHIDTPFRPDEAREFGSDGQNTYHFAHGGALVATVDNGQVIGDGVLTREGVRITGALDRSANAFFVPFNVERAPPRPSDAIGFSMARRVETSADTSIGPAGAYLMSGPLAFNELPSPEEVRPEPGTLARYAPQAQSCAYRPAIPPGWLYWGPDCAARPDRIDAWAVNGAYRLRFARIERRDFTVLQEMDPEQPGRVRREWRGARFDMSGLVPTPQGTAELWSDGALVFNGPFAGVEPQGEGFCGRSEAEGGGVEPCTYAGGQRADALYLARIEQERLDAQFSARAAEAQRLRAEREQERITAQREEARRIAQAAADRRAAQRAQNDAFWGAVVSGFGQASVQIQAQQDADAANMAAFNAQLAETQRRIAAQQAANAATAPASAGASAPRGGPPPTSAPPPSAAPPARIAMPSSAPSSSATSASAPAAPIAMQEAVVICPMRDGLLGGVTCYGPAGQGFATVSNIGDIATICHAGRARTTPREYSRQGENRIFGCGYGIDPTRPGVNEPPNLDATVRVSASIPERRLFHCAPGTNFCTTP